MVVLQAHAVYLVFDTLCFCCLTLVNNEFNNCSINNETVYYVMCHVKKVKHLSSKYLICLMNLLANLNMVRTRSFFLLP